MFSPSDGRAKERPTPHLAEDMEVTDEVPGDPNFDPDAPEYYDGAEPGNEGV